MLAQSKKTFSNARDVQYAGAQEAVAVQDMSKEDQRACDLKVSKQVIREFQQPICIQQHLI